jgi:hypothetical protein
VPILIEVKSIYGQLIPVIGMAASSFVERSFGETFMVWSFYIIGGIIIGGLVMWINKM